MSDRPLKVALVTNRFLPQVGGAEINIDHQARYLARHVALTVYCPKRVSGPERETRDGFRIERLRDAANRGQVFPNSKSHTFCPSVFWKIALGGYDIVHCFPALNRNNMLAVLAAKLSGAKIVFCFFDYLDYAAIIKATGQVDPAVLDHHRPNRKTRLFLSWMDHIFAISQREIRFLRAYNSHVTYSPVPILLDEYREPAASPRARYGIRDDDFVFLCLNRVSVIKGQDIAVEAFAKVAADLPNAVLVIVGNKAAELALTAQIESRISEKNLTRRVVWTGMVERPELLGWLQHSDIQVVPARFMNSGAVVVESWISGTPVIQSDAVDPNLVIEGGNGYLFPSLDAGALAEKMRLAYHQRDRLSGMAARGKEVVLEKYTYEYLTSLYLETYERISGVTLTRP